MNVRMLGRRQTLVGVAGTMLAAPAVAQQRVKSGTVYIEQVQVAFIGSGNVGSGTLHFHGRSYRFSVGGLGVGGFGISKMEASGDVYDLKELRQFLAPMVRPATGPRPATRAVEKCGWRTPTA